MASDHHTKALFVLGMHRSGTSALTGVLAELGIQLGPRLYGAHSGVNDKGYFEHSDIADTDEDILLACGSSWDDILPLTENWWQKAELEKYRNKLRKFIHRDFSRASLWGLKDPRICRLLPLWLRLINELSITASHLIIFRNPFEVAKSLERRDGMSRDKAMLLWLDHNLLAEYWTRPERRTLVSFQELLRDPGNVLQSVQSGLNLDFPVPLGKALPRINEFLSSDMRHHVADSIAPGTDLEIMAVELLEVLNAASDTGEVQIDRLDRLRQQLNTYQDSMPPVMADHVRSLRQRHGEAQLLLNRIIRSRSWPWGKPFRYLERLLGGDI